MPDIELLEPEALEKFNHYNIDGIDIYIRKIFSANGNIRFVLSSFLFLKSIEVRGINVL